MTEPDDPPMAFGFKEAPAHYIGPTQRARVWTEGWVAREMYCPSCGVRPLGQYGANRPAADFFCAGCDEQFELKSQKGRFGPRVCPARLVATRVSVHDPRGRRP